MSIIDLCRQLVAGGILLCTDVAADAADDKLWFCAQMLSIGRLCGLMPASGVVTDDSVALLATGLLDHNKGVSLLASADCLVCPVVSYLLDTPDVLTWVERTSCLVWVGCCCCCCCMASVMLLFTDIFISLFSFLFLFCVVVLVACCLLVSVLFQLCYAHVDAHFNTLHHCT